ncbi:hypothetical protein HZY86_05995 [Aerococcaceae bacterium DSM 111020]|nr:hypothetical protein [Aerococcaceae bacterium DSM 111020]
MTEWSKKYIKKWQSYAKNYPTKALLFEAQRVSEAQEKRIEAQKSKLDASAWRRES